MPKGGVNAGETGNLYKIVRKKPQTAIAESKTMHFEQLCREDDSDPWGGSYKTVMTSIGTKRSPPITCHKSLNDIINATRRYWKQTKHQSEGGSRLRWHTEHSCQTGIKDNTKTFRTNLYCMLERAGHNGRNDE